MASADGALLTVDQVYVTFGGVRALDGVSMVVRAGRLTGLIGPNGAGKTTLFDTISGFVRPKSGNVYLRGRRVTRMSPARRARAGVRRTFQGAELFDDLTVFENVNVARTAGVVAEAILERLALGDCAQEPAGTLPAGLRRMVGIARALAGAPAVLLLDEPGAGLLPSEVDSLAMMLRDLCSDKQLAILLVDHDMSLIGQACSEVHVLNFGRVVMSGTPEAVRADAGVQEAYLGV